MLSTVWFTVLSHSLISCVPENQLKLARTIADDTTCETLQPYTVCLRSSGGDKVDIMAKQCANFVEDPMQDSSSEGMHCNTWLTLLCAIVLHVVTCM